MHEGNIEELKGKLHVGLLSVARVPASAEKSVALTHWVKSEISMCTANLIVVLRAGLGCASSDVKFIPPEEPDSARESLLKKHLKRRPAFDIGYNARVFVSIERSSGVAGSRGRRGSVSIGYYRRSEGFGC